MTLIWLICYFKRIKPSQQKHSGVVLPVCCRRHPEIFLCVVSFLSVRSAGLWECGVARSGAALRCRLGTHPSCLGSADRQIFPHSSPSSVFIVDTFFSSPPSLFWKTLHILDTFPFYTSNDATTLGNITISQVFHLQSMESLFDCYFLFLKNNGVSLLQGELINMVSTVKNISSLDKTPPRLQQHLQDGVQFHLTDAFLLLARSKD